MSGFHKQDLDSLVNSQKSQQGGKKSLLERVKDKRFDCNKQVKESEYILTHECVLGNLYKVAPKGGLLVMSGKSKSRKSTVLGAIIASGLDNSPHLGFTLNVPTNENILWFDTEMQDYEFYSAQHLILRQAGTNQTPSNFNSYALVDFTSSERLDIIEELTDDKTRVVIIDGIADCVTNFNDLVECYNILARIQKMQARGILVVVVIHENFSNAKMTGHLGTMLEKKASCVIQTARGEGDGTGVITCKVSRKKDFPAYDFKVDEYNMPISQESKFWQDAQEQTAKWVSLGATNENKPNLDNADDVPF